MWLAVLMCLGTAVSWAASPPATEAKSKTVSDTQAEAWLKSWQKRLHLEDWKVDVHLVRSTDLKPDTLGNLKWNTVTRTAAIKVLSPIDYELAPSEIAEDVEYTIVHELVHLQLSVLPRDLNKKDVEESVVNKISDALMSLDKGPSFRARSVPAPRSPGKPAEADAAGRITPVP